MRPMLAPDLLWSPTVVFCPQFEDLKKKLIDTKESNKEPKCNTRLAI